MTQYCTKWPKWRNMVQNGQNDTKWPKMAQNGTTFPKMDQKGPEDTKWPKLTEIYRLKIHPLCLNIVYTITYRFSAFSTGIFQLKKLQKKYKLPSFNHVSSVRFFFLYVFFSRWFLGTTGLVQKAVLIIIRRKYTFKKMLLAFVYFFYYLTTTYCQSFA